MKLIFSTLLLLFVCIATIQAQESPSLEGKTILFVYGGWDGHDPKPCHDLLEPWMKSEGATVISSDNLDVYADDSLMAAVDLIVQCWTMGSISPEQEKGLLKAVREGKAIAGWHGGTGDSFRNNTEYQFMIGGQWVAHPGNVIDYDVQITNHRDEVTRGLKDFHMHSEQYYMHVDPNVEVLATTTYVDNEAAPWINGRTMPVVWKTRYGKGKVFYSSLCHVVQDFEVPEALEIMKRGIRWAACVDGTDAFEAFAKHFSESAAFAYTKVSGVEVMLVSQETFGNNKDSDLQAIEASIFAKDPKGKIVSLGSIRSQGTLYPVSIHDGKLMVAGHHFVKIYSIRGDIPELVLDEYEDADGPKLTKMFETFEKGEPIKFEKSK